MEVRIRESDLPEEGEWSSFFDPPAILQWMGLDEHVRDVADFGCGYGTFTIPAAGLVSGIVYALDIDPDMVTRVNDKTRNMPRNNVEAGIRDILRDGSGLPEECVDYVLLFSVLHTRQPKTLLKEAYRVLRKTGRVAILNWTVDPDNPCGPPIAMRPSIAQSIEWCLKTGFDSSSIQVFDFKPYQYGAILRK
jgi:SAM-dependent methyltransferase